MLNLKKKVKELQENTASLEARAICKEFLENFFNLTDFQIASTLVEKLKTIEDSDKHVAKFIQIAEKIISLNDLGVAKSIAALKESHIYAYPGLRYGLDKIENSLTYKQVRVVEEETKIKDFKPGDTWTALKMGSTNSFRLQESNVAGKPEFMLIDTLLETLKNFSWDKDVETIYTDMKKKRADLSESIDIAISMYNMRGNKGSFFFDPILPKLEEHLLNPTESSRSSIIEELRKLNFYPVAKSLSESLSRIQQNSTKGIQVISDNTKCTISSIYSPVLLENGGEYFFSRGNYFFKKDGKISKVNEDSVTSLPEKFVNVCRIISSPNVFIKEGKISFYLKRDKVEILENEKKVEIRFNGSRIEGGELAKRMISAGLFRLEESKIAYDIQSLVESFDNIFDLDFGKIIESKAYPGSYVILMKDGNKIYLNKTNESTRSNEFFSDLNATQARNLIMEFIGFDIKESMEEYLERDEIHLKELREAQSNIIRNLSIVEANLNKVNSTLEDAFMRTNPEIQNLKSVLEEELSKLKAQHRNISQQIKSFESKTTSDAGYDVGEEVKLTETGDFATILSVNSSRGSVTVVTSKGKTVEVPVSKISSLEAAIKKAEAKNEGSEDNKKKRIIAEEDSAGIESDSENTVTSNVSKPEEGYVKATVSADQGGPYAGEVIEVLADDYASKGDEELIEVKIGDDLIFIKKKFIKLGSAALEKPEELNTQKIEEDDDENFSLDSMDDDDEDFDEEDDDSDEEEIEFEVPSKLEEIPVKHPGTNLEVLRAKLKKSLEELEDIRSDMESSFTSTNTISTTIQSIKGMLDALKKDQMNILSRDK